MLETLRERERRASVRRAELLEKIAAVARGLAPGAEGYSSWPRKTGSGCSSTPNSASTLPCT
jgi:hypothetical protein